MNQKYVVVVDIIHATNKKKGKWDYKPKSDKLCVHVQITLNIARCVPFLNGSTL